MKKVVFLGPSLKLAEAQAVCADAIFLPPARQSDIVAAAARFKPDIIGLIDGVFLQDLSVWHKEILYALKQGIVVAGASSMGALRAAETARYGTIGIGEIYRMYEDGTLTDDDEVALLHGPAESGYKKLSEPMVNVRATLAAAAAAGAIPAETLEPLLTQAKSIHFTERTWPAICAAAPEPDRLKQFVARHYVDQKKLDAIALLQTIDTLVEKPEPATFDFNATLMFSALYQRDRSVECEETVLPLYEIAEYTALHHPDFTAINETALDRALVETLADLTGVEVTREALAEETGRFRTARGLADETPFNAWLADNHLDADSFDTLINQIARRRRLHLWFLSHKAMEKQTPALLDELRIRGDYPEMAAKAALQNHLCGKAEEMMDHQIDLRQLAQQAGVNIPGKLTDWSFFAGFRNLDDLRLALLRSKTARAKMQEMLDSIGDLPETPESA